MRYLLEALVEGHVENALFYNGRRYLLSFVMAGECSFVMSDQQLV
jgi:hypothetical protein